MNLSGYDVILGMDWPNENRAHVDCEHKMVTVLNLSGKELLVHGNNANTKVGLISEIKAVICLQQGCIAFLACVIDVKEKGLIDDILWCVNSRMSFRKIYLYFRLTVKLSSVST
jgi:hypothetical protein